MSEEKTCPNCGQVLREYTMGAFGAKKYVVACANHSCKCRCSHGGGFEFSWKLMNNLIESKKNTVILFIK